MNIIFPKLRITRLSLLNDHTTSSMYYVVSNLCEFLLWSRKDDVLKNVLVAIDFNGIVPYSMDTNGYQRFLQISSCSSEESKSYRF